MTHSWLNNPFVRNQTITAVRSARRPARRRRIRRVIGRPARRAARPQNDEGRSRVAPPPFGEHNGRSPVENRRAGRYCAAS